jgi:APA family basic amino acid/polyamine antiporter
VPSIRVRTTVAALGVVVLAAFLAVHTWKDLTGPAAAWYFRSTPVWAVVMAIGSFVYWIEVRGLRRAGVDLHARFAALPPE